MDLRKQPAPALVLPALLALAALACKPKAEDQPTQAPASALVNETQKISIEPAPEHLRGRVALAADGRIYARPAYTAASWELQLPAPPLTAGEAPPRARALRVVGVVHPPADELGNAGDFVAVTNDLRGEDEDLEGGCGRPITGSAHLRMLLYVPEVHLAEVTTEALELAPFPGSEDKQLLRIGAGARVGEALPPTGLPKAPPGSRWRWVDGDGLRALVPIPDAAVGKAWDPGRGAKLGESVGELIGQDPEGSTLWVRDDGGAQIELTTRNECGELWRVVDKPSEVESLRALAEDAFYEQRPTAEPLPVVELDADYRIAANTPLRWPDGELAGEVLIDWSVAMSVGQNWDDQRCFSLPLGGELEPIDSPALACVAPSAIEPLQPDLGFAQSEEFELGGSIVLGPAELLSGGPYDDQSLRIILNAHHATVSECLRPLLAGSEELEAAAWELELSVAENGRVDDATVTALGPSSPGVEDCLRAEPFTWMFPAATARLLIPVTLGPWQGAPPDEAPEDEAPAETKNKGKGKGKSKVMILRDEGEDLEDLGE